MGSTEDTTTTQLYDPTQPFLSSKPYPSIYDPTPTPTPTPTTTSITAYDSDADPTQYLQISYNYGPRPIKDIPFLILFLLFALSTFAFGIFASVHHNPNSSAAFLYDPTTTSCIKVLSSTPGSHNSPSSFYFHSSSKSLWEILIWTLVFTLVISAPLTLCVLLLLRHYAKQLVYASLPFFVVVPIAINFYWFVACTVSSTCSDAFPLAYRILVLVFVFLIIALLVWIIVSNWHRIELTISIIAVASDALWRNLRLFVVLPLLTLGLWVYYVPIVVFLVFTRLNGKIVPKAEEDGEYNCAWKQDSWVPAYYALAVLTMLWSATAMVEAQVYVISGTVAQWYFSKDDSNIRRSIKRSLRNAFGPSSGTICLSGLLICVVRIVRAAVDNARKDAPGIVNLILKCCVNALLRAFEFLNKFTINFAAITGEAYCTSARMTYELLKRNLLSAVFVETVSTRILAGIVFVLSAIYAVVVCAILQAVSDLGVDSYFVAVMAWVLLIVVLGYFVHVLDNVIDSVYICYAIDKDRGEVCKPEVHEVYVHLPISRNQNTSALVARTTLV